MAAAGGLRRLDCAAAVAFAPSGGLLSCGTAAGTIDPSFSSQSSLQVRSSGRGAVREFLEAARSARSRRALTRRRSRSAACA
eukprot:355656-Chlamydomonas_euryale.AAC.6